MAAGGACSWAAIPTIARPGVRAGRTNPPRPARRCPGDRCVRHPRTGGDRRRPGVGARSLCPAGLRRGTGPAGRRCEAHPGAIFRLSGLYALRRRAGWPHRRQLCAAGDGQYRPSRRPLRRRRRRGGGASAARPRRRPGNDGVRPRGMPREGLLQDDAVLEREARARARFLRVAGLRAPRLQLSRRSGTGVAMTAIDGEQPLLIAEGVAKWYGRQLGCRNVSLELYEGEVMAVVGESGSGKTTLLQLLSAQMEATSGRVLYRMRDGATRDLATLGEAERRFLARTDWGYVHQDATLGLRMTVSAGANVGERLMAVGWRHYGRIRGAATNWLNRVEIDPARIDHPPRTYSGGMRQRLQIARNLVTQPRLVLMDEPTGGLDVSVQARLLDLLRGLVTDLKL